MTSRTVLAACRIIAVTCYAAALFTPSRFLAAVGLSLFGLLTVITLAATRRLRADRRQAGRGARNHPDHERHHP